MKAFHFSWYIFHVLDILVEYFSWLFAQSPKVFRKIVQIWIEERHFQTHLTFCINFRISKPTKTPPFKLESNYPGNLLSSFKIFGIACLLAMYFMDLVVEKKWRIMKCFTGVKVYLLPLCSKTAFIKNLHSNVLYLT